jgi:hypothetical protein
MSLISFASIFVLFETQIYQFHFLESIPKGIKKAQTILFGLLMSSLKRFIQTLLI